jgi:hypothetical protein
VRRFDVSVFMDRICGNNGYCEEKECFPVLWGFLGGDENSEKKKNQKISKKDS